MINTTELLSDFFAGDTVDELREIAFEYGVECDATPSDEQPHEGETVLDVDTPDVPTMQRIIATQVDLVARNGLKRLIERAMDGEPDAVRFMLDRNMIQLPARLASDARIVGKWLGV